MIIMLLTYGITLHIFINRAVAWNVENVCFSGAKRRGPLPRPKYIYTVGAFSIGGAFFFEKRKLRALIWHKPDLSIIISNKVMTF